MIVPRTAPQINKATTLLVKAVLNKKTTQG